MNSSAPPRPVPSLSARLAAWRPTTRGLLAIAAAFVAGLALFLFVWSGQRHATPAPVRATADTADLAPLPAPMPGGLDGASGMEEPDAAAIEERPRLVETPRPATPPPPTAAPAPRAAPAVADASPTPISSPAPRYPQRALRRRETGSVRVQVDVGADGVPTDVTVVSSSASRDLDRAAVDAVRRWRFSPATRDGQAIAGTVVVPIDFRL